MSKLSQLKKLAVEQMNRVQITFCPHSQVWTVNLGLFSSENPDLDDAAGGVVQAVSDYRANTRLGNLLTQVEPLDDDDIILLKDWLAILADDVEMFGATPEDTAKMSAITARIGDR